MKIHLKPLLLSLLLLLFVASASAADLVIYDDAEQTKALQPGDTMASFTVQSVEGETVEFRAGERDKPLMIITFRGGWCPYCNTQLQELRKAVPELSRQGMEVVFFSGDRPEVLYTGLKDDTKTVIADQNFTIYSDANTEAASALGIAFKLPQKQLERMISSPRLDAADSSIAKHGALSVPSVFIINTDGTVDFTYSNPDYKVRLSQDDLMHAAIATLEKDQ